MPDTSRANEAFRPTAILKATPSSQYVDGQWYLGCYKTESEPRLSEFIYIADRTGKPGIFREAVLVDGVIQLSSWFDVESQYTMLEPIPEIAVLSRLNRKEKLKEQLTQLKELLDAILPEALPLAREKYPDSFD